ncbi:MAG: hypothetical protein EA416_10040 [Trueperaceae bacterium]|nr:MAG: hypothetical protein EA416_10040 [Trueperaceae bacterium]
MLSRTRTTILATLAVALGLTLAACGGGIGQEDVDALRSQLEVVEQRLDDVEGMLADARTEIDGNGVELVDEAQRELVDTRAMIADVLAELEPPPPAPEADPMAPAPDAPAF